MAELFGNLAKTTINQVGGISATSTSVVVSALNGSNTWNSFPSSGNFRVIFGTDNNAEIALCTSVNTSTNTLTLTRGVEGSNAQSWANGTAITLSITAQSLNQTIADAFQVGPFSSLPSTGRPTGSRYQAIDGHTPWIWNPYTNNWQPEILGIMGVRPPLASTFTTPINSPVSLIDSNGVLIYTSPSQGSGGSAFSGYFFSLTGLPAPVFIEMLARQQDLNTNASSNYAGFGPFFRESSSGKIYGFMTGQLNNGSNNITLYMESEVYSSPTTRTANLFSPTVNSDGPMFLRVRRDTANLYAEYSRNRIIWTQFETRTIASVFTSAPDQIGLGGFSAGFSGVTHVLHYNYGLMPAAADSIFTNTAVQIQPVQSPPQLVYQNGWLGTVLNH